VFGSSEYERGNVYYQLIVCTNLNYPSVGRVSNTNVVGRHISLW